MAEDEWSQGDIVRALVRIEAAVTTLTTTLPQTYVPATLWEQRNRHVDFVHAGLGREIGDLRSELRSKRLPWPTVLSAVVAAVALGVSLLPG